MDDTQTRLVRYFAAMLRVPQSEVRTDVSVLELGADSIMLVEAQRWLRDEFGCDIEVKAFFENLNSIQTIAAPSCVACQDARSTGWAWPPFT